MRYLALCLLLPAALNTQAALNETEFQACVDELRNVAAQQGLDSATIDNGLTNLELQRRVLELDRRQPEFFQTFWQYLDARVTEQRVKRGRELLARYRPLLDQIYADYGVRPEYLVAFWGLETNFGSYFGNMPVLDSLATLACDPRRSDYFTGELMEALKILQGGHISRDEMRGSWAGAMGHTQFMPSTFTRYGVDGSGDGRIDLWNSLPDVFASSANYLSSIGWQRGERWGREVRVPDDFDWGLSGLDQRKSLARWAELGVLAADGSSLPGRDMEAALLLPAGHRGPAFLVYRNFDRIMRWNTSISYALSVGHLADRIAGMGKLEARPASDQRPLKREEVEEIQQRLNGLGFDSGRPDGMVGR
ncbi:MAG: lytic murein transglycosylase, partial [Ectothiorhodospiraceae bacterium]|nr:lytic murein transglycosylase [Ectothiorhodospiraceae bacterium]